MSNTRELIVFIPGIGVKEPETYLEKLIQGIRGFCQARGIDLRALEDSGEPGTGRRRLELQSSSGELREIVLQEVYWGDLRPRLSTEPVTRKILRGLNLFVYWVSSMETWKRAARSKYMMFNMIFTLILILTWYYGAFAAGMTAIGSNPEMFGQPLPVGVATFLADLGNSMGSWNVWVIAAVIMGALPATEIIDISYASKAYLQNRHGMRHRVCSRVAKSLSDGAKGGDNGYDRITVLAHSFGAVVGVDVMAEFTAVGTPRVRIITMGGPLLLMAGRSARLGRAIDAVLANPNVEEWIDFYSDHDWLCTETPIDDDVEKFRSHKITATVPVDEKFSGESHDLYFADWDVVETLLASPQS